MNISIEVPDDIAAQIGSRWRDLPRRALESLVAEAYRERLISRPQAQEMLGFSSRFELDAFLEQNRIFLGYSEDDLEADRRTLDELLAQ